MIQNFEKRKILKKHIKSYDYAMINLNLFFMFHDEVKRLFHTLEHFFYPHPCMYSCDLLQQIFSALFFSFLDIFLYHRVTVLYANIFTFNLKEKLGSNIFYIHAILHGYILIYMHNQFKCIFFSIFFVSYNIKIDSKEITFSIEYKSSIFRKLEVELKDTILVFLIKVCMSRFVF